MAVENSLWSIPIVAGEDLNTAGAGTGHQYKAVQIDGTVVDASGDNAAAGILANLPENGEMATVNVMGLMKGVAGAAVSAGAAVMVANSGYLITATSGYSVVGKCYMSAANSGDVFTFLGNFANGHIGT